MTCFLREIATANKEDSQLVLICAKHEQCIYQVTMQQRIQLPTVQLDSLFKSMATL